jgi:hypothetical protein
MSLLSPIKKRLSPRKDLAGRNIKTVINRLSTQTRTSSYSWSYITDEAVYENTSNGKKLHSHEVSGRIRDV